MTFLAQLWLYIAVRLGKVVLGWLVVAVWEKPSVTNCWRHWYSYVKVLSWSKLYCWNKPQQKGWAEVPRVLTMTSMGRYVCHFKILQDVTTVPIFLCSNETISASHRFFVLRFSISHEDTCMRRLLALNLLSISPWQCWHLSLVFLGDWGRPFNIIFKFFRPTSDYCWGVQTVKHLNTELRSADGKVETSQAKKIQPLQDWSAECTITIAVSGGYDCCRGWNFVYGNRILKKDSVTGFFVVEIF